MSMPENSSQWSIARQERRDSCPICQQPLITRCNNFKHRVLVPRVPTEQLFEPVASGGKTKKKKGTRKKRKTSSRKKQLKQRLKCL
jgi:hypothetical protein